MSQLPLIGITATPVSDTQPYGTFDRYRVSADYARAVEAAGGVPVILPPQAQVSPLLDALAGLIFSGGADVDPAQYGSDVIHPATYDISAERDDFELRLLAGGLERDLPMLCICRGIQILNVGLGGTLYQHIPDDVKVPLPHRQHEVSIPAQLPAHSVSLTPGAMLESIFGQCKADVNSLHHQAIDQLAPSLMVEAWAEDGVIEAVSLPGRTHVLGVQWHPELMFVADATQLKLFQSLAERARLAVDQRLAAAVG